MIERIRSIPDEAERAQSAHALLREILAVHPQLADVRREAVVQLHDERGWTDERIGELLGGVTKVQVGRIRAAAPTTDGEEPDAP